MNNKKYTIYIIVMFVMLMWGLNVSAIKVLVEAFMPVTITALRIFTGAIVVFLILKYMNAVRMPKSKEWYYIVGGALFSIVLHHYFLASGLTLTSATNASLILGTGPVLTVIFATIILKRMPSWIQTIGFIAGFTGVTYTVLASSSNGVQGINLGDFYILLSIISQALSFIVIKKAVETMDPRLLTGYMLLVGSVILFMISLWQEPGGIATLSNGSLRIWLVFIFSAVIATGVGQMAYNFAISKLGPSETAIFLNFNTFFAMLGAAVFLNETLMLAHFIGLIFIIVGVIFGSGGMEAWLIERRRKRM